MKFFRYLLIGLVPLLFIGCASKSSGVDMRTQLQNREFQSKIYDINDTKMMSRVILNVLQDDGYIVRNVNPELGFFNAEKRVEGKGYEFAAYDIYYPIAVYKYFDRETAVSFECTINVTQYKKESKVRAVFYMKSLTSGNSVKDEHPVDDENFYKAFFAKIDKAVFLEKQGL
jgi:hypothetical protein